MSKELDYIDQILDIMKNTVEHIDKTDKTLFAISIQMINLMEVLTKKGVLDADNLRYIRTCEVNTEDEKPAHWMKTKSFENHISEWECSNCKATFQCEGDIDLPYCPRCGKEMEV